MKKNFTLGALALCLCMCLHAQVYTGKKVVSATFDVGRTSIKENISNQVSSDSYKTTSFTSYAEILFGKINRKNLLFAYGIQFQHQVLRSYENGDQVSRYKQSAWRPTLLLQKYYAISEKIWYTPAARLVLRYRDKNETTIYGSDIQVRPLALTVNFNKRCSVQLAAGDISAGYEHIGSESGTYQSKVQRLYVNVALNTWATGLLVTL